MSELVIPPRLRSGWCFGCQLDRSRLRRRGFGVPSMRSTSSLHLGEFLAVVITPPNLRVDEFPSLSPSCLHVLLSLVAMRLMVARATIDAVGVTTAAPVLRAGSLGMPRFTAFLATQFHLSSNFHHTSKGGEVMSILNYFINLSNLSHFHPFPPSPGIYTKIC